MLEKRRNPDGSPVRVTFYVSSGNAARDDLDNSALVKRAWRAAVEKGHEIGNHTHRHEHGSGFTEEQWRAEIKSCIDFLTRPYDPEESLISPDVTKGIGVKSTEIYGFRTPFLEYNDAVFEAVRNAGMVYDCSIEEGFEPNQDGSNFFWPYTLDNGSPGHDIQVEWEQKDPMRNHAGLWEMPVYAVIVPPDDKCAEYGVPRGLRAKMKGYNDYFDQNDGKITGFDYNLWVLFKMTKAEFLATLKYSLDQRLKGNRAPFMFGGHTDIYSSKYPEAMGVALRERQEAVEEFVDYALGKPEVRIVPVKEILDWIQNPKTL
jgi:peptidoglycan/xylan/chitin deacetylase (PgdA/CDA1 family)